MNAWLLSILSVSLVTSLVALALSFLLNRLKGKIDIKTRYFLWLGILISLLLPFRPHFGRGVIKVQEETLDLPLREIALVPEKLATAPAKPSLVSQFLALPWLKILLVVWLVGAVVVFGLQLYRSWKFYRLLKRWSQPVDDQRILDSLEGTKELLALTNSIKVSHYHLTPTPMLVGFRQPHILLPTLDYTDEELDLIFEHELTHFKHRDVYVNFLIMLVTSLHWFNPIVGFIGRETQEAAESYCDHDVLAKQDKAYRTFYGETIISMIGKGRQKTVGLSSCFYSNKFKLKRRMEAIVSTELSLNWLTALAIALVTGSILFSGSVFAMVEKTPLVAETPRVLVRPDSEELRLRISDLLGANPDELADWKMTDEGDDYQISFSYADKDYLYRFAKSSGKLTQQTIEEKATSKATSSASSSSTSSTKASASSSASTATANTAIESSQAPASVTSTPVTETPAVAEVAPATSTQVIENYQPVEQQIVQQPVVQEPVYQAPAAPAVSYVPATPSYSYDDDDYDDDYDDDDDD